jgi:hypothetical protein
MVPEEKAHLRQKLLELINQDDSQVGAGRAPPTLPPDAAIRAGAQLVMTPSCMEEGWVAREGARA